MTPTDKELFMIVYDIHAPNTWPEKNGAKFLFIHLIADEQQVELNVEGHNAYIGFYKGNFSVSVDGKEPINVCDSGVVEANSLTKAFLETRIELLSKKTEDTLRIVPATAIWDYLCVTIPGLEQADEVSLKVHLPGRNGVADAEGLTTERKDW